VDCMNGETHSEMSVLLWKSKPQRTQRKTKRSKKPQRTTEYERQNIKTKNLTTESTENTENYN
jgi:hypothetical protein